MTWKDRLQETVILVSPGGDEFTGLWRGDPRNLVKKLGIFEFPGIPGAKVQDLEVGADTGTLSFFFEGPDHDIEAARFFKSCKQTGAWTIEHPLYGKVLWQFATIKEDDQPVESANVTAFSIEWIEPLGGDPEASTAQVAASVSSQSIVVQAKANAQAEASAVTDRPSSITRFKTGIRAAADLVVETLKPIYSGVGGLNDEIISVDRAITNALASSVFSVTGLAGQVQTLISLPSKIEGDLLTRLSYYEQLLRDAITLTDAQQEDTTVNDAVIREVTTVSTLAAMADVVVSSAPKTRSEAISALTSIAVAYDIALTGLDGSQTSLDGAYISQSESFNDTSLLLAGVADLLLKQSFDLASAKIITLKRDRTPVEIAMTEGVDIDQFIATNNLKNNDILLLPPGTTVIVFS